MKLQVGITTLQPCWEILLRQVGVPFQEIPNGIAINSEEFVSIIVTDEASTSNKNILLAYLNGGGTLLMEADTAKHLFNIPTTYRYIKFINPYNDSIFSRAPACDVYRWCSVAKQANLLEDESGTNTCYEHYSANGKIIVFPSGFSSLISDQKIKRKNFYARYGKKETNERVSKVSKGSVRFYIQSALEHLFHFRKVPFVSLWHFPDGECTIFGFRIDTDFGTQEQIMNLYDVCKENGIRATWFVETLSSKKWIDVFATFQNQEIGLHCYKHKIFSTYKENFESLSEGLRILKEAKIFPEGFAAPYGEWNKELGRVIEHLGFSYSSEFGYAYDALPFAPCSNNSSSTACQIPIHPISFGRLSAGAHSDDEMIKYYLDVISQKIKLFEPIILYTHPGEQRFNILSTLFNKIHELNIPVFTLGEYAEWWKKRETIKFTAMLTDGKILIDSPQNDPSMWIRASFPDNDIYLSRLPSHEYSLERRLEPAGAADNYTAPYKELRTTTLRMRWHDVLHSYRKFKQ